MAELERNINLESNDEFMEYLKSKEEILAVYIFGSKGTEYEKEDSDVDLAILFADAKPLFAELSLEAEIEEIIAGEVDLVSLNKCNILLKYRIIKEGQKIYEQDPIYTADFIEEVLKHYFDFGLKLKKLKADFRQGLKEEISSENR